MKKLNGLNAARNLCFGIARAAILALVALISLTSFAANTPPPPGTQWVVEYFHRDLRYYFRTSDVLEISLLDSGVGGPAWARTGDDFLAYPVTDSPSTAFPVCRFYGSADPGPNTHFYTADPDECDRINKYFAAIIDPRTPKIAYEKSSFAADVPNAGVCVSEKRPVWRLFNNGATRGVMPNHRYTTITTERDRLVAAGWSDEGVALCEALAPTQSRILGGMVRGIRYQFADGVAGIIDAAGTLPYRGATTVTFKVGNLTLGTYPTRLNYFFETNTSDRQFAKNVLKLLMSLDSNRDFSDGISISAETDAALQVGASVNFAAEDFDNQLAGLLARPGLNTASEHSARELKALAATTIITDSAAMRFLNSAAAENFFSTDYWYLKYFRGTAKSSPSFVAGNTVSKRARQYYYERRVLPELQALNQEASALYVNTLNARTKILGAASIFFEVVATGIDIVLTENEIAKSSSPLAAAIAAAKAGSKEALKLFFEEKYCPAQPTLLQETICSVVLDMVDSASSVADIFTEADSTQRRAAIVAFGTGKLAKLFEVADITGRLMNATDTAIRVQSITLAKDYFSKFATLGADKAALKSALVTGNCFTSDTACVLEALDPFATDAPRPLGLPVDTWLGLDQATRVNAAIAIVAKYEKDALNFASITEEWITGAMLVIERSCNTPLIDVNATDSLLSSDGYGQFAVSASTTCATAKSLSLNANGVTILSSATLAAGSQFQKTFELKPDQAFKIVVRAAVDGIEVGAPQTLSYGARTLPQTYFVKRVLGELAVGQAVDLQITSTGSITNASFVIRGQGACELKSSTNWTFTCVFANAGEQTADLMIGVPAKLVQTFALNLSKAATSPPVPRILSGGEATLNVGESNEPVRFPLST